MPDTQTRQLPATLHRAATTGREFTGIAVPFDETYEIPGYYAERFTPDTIFDIDPTAKVFWRHDEPIGLITAATTTETGLEVTGRISDTSQGREAKTLLADGVIDRLSIGFDPIDTHTQHRDNDTDLTIIDRARIREVSLVPFPAYEHATITEIRSRKENPMPTVEHNITVNPELTREDFDGLSVELRKLVEDKAREFTSKLDTLDTRSTTPIGAEFRDAGDFLKQLATTTSDRHDAAVNLYRAYQGTVLADGAPQAQWIADRIRLVEQRRRITSLFTREAAPATGNVVEYYKLDTDTSTVAKQAAEGDNLAFGQVKLTTATATLDTYGGYTSLSRQAIERSTAPLLATAQRAQTLAYARATENAVRDFAYTEIAAQSSAGNKLDAAATTAALTNADWLDLIVDAADLFEERGFALTTLGVSKDVFKTLYRLEDGAGHNLMNVFGTGVNVTGEVNLKGISGNLANLPVTLLPAAPTQTASFIDPVSITVWESAGAPLQLQDDNVLNLTRDFSVYGYLGVGATLPGGLLPIEFPEA